MHLVNPHFNHVFIVLCPAVTLLIGEVDLEDSFLKFLDPQEFSDCLQGLLDSVCLKIEALEAVLVDHALHLIEHLNMLVFRIAFVFVLLHVVIQIFIEIQADISSHLRFSENTCALFKLFHQNINSFKLSFDFINSGHRLFHIEFYLFHLLFKFFAFFFILSRFFPLVVQHRFLILESECQLVDDIAEFAP